MFQKLENAPREINKHKGCPISRSLRDWFRRPGWHRPDGQQRSAIQWVQPRSLA